MKKKIVLRVIVGVIGVVLLGVGVSYWWILGQYNATMYSKARKWIHEDFLDNNRVRGASYINKEYNPDMIYDEENWVEKYIYDKESPKNRTFIIKDEITFNNIFKENSFDVDFDKEMVILYMVSDVCPRECYILNILNDDDILTIQYMHKFSNAYDTVQPYPRCMVVKMKKMNITGVEFIEVY